MCVAIVSLLMVSVVAPAATGRVAATGSLGASESRGVVNPAHLDFLVEPVEIAGRRMAIVHIYSEAPAYRWVDASGEGITALDDIARAVLVYLELGSDDRGGAGGGTGSPAAGDRDVPPDA